MGKGFIVSCLFIVVLIASTVPGSGRAERVVSSASPTIPVQVLNPKPTCIEPKPIPLIFAGESKANATDNAFLQNPFSLEVDSRKNVYVFDLAQFIVMKFDSGLNYKTSIGRSGQGPGDYFKLGKMSLLSLFTDGENLFVGDRLGRKVMKFDGQGAFKGETRIDCSRKVLMLRPVVNRDGDIHIADSEKYLVNVYNPQGKKKATIGTVEELKKSLFMVPQVNDDALLNASISGIDYDLVGERTLAIYVCRSGILYVHQPGKPLRSIPLWPKAALSTYSKELKKKKEKNGRIGCPALGRMFVDKDEPGVVYVQSSMGEPNYIYRFTIDGRLLQVFSMPNSPFFVRICYKRHNTFYGFGYDKEDNPAVWLFREGKQASDMHNSKNIGG